MAPKLRAARRALPFCTAAWAWLLPVQAEVVISEFMASNGSTVLEFPSVEDFPDWVELHNRGTESVDLSGWSLTDDPGQPQRYILPQTVVPADGYLLVVAGSETPSGLAEILHAPFRLDASGEYLALYDSDGTQAHAYGDPDATLPEDRLFPPQHPDVSYGLGRHDEHEYFPQPTPGAPNGRGVAGFVAPLTFSVERGFFFDPIEVAISCATEGVRLLYTTDGREPSEGSIFTGPVGTEYQGPIFLTTTTPLRVRGFRSGFQPSPPAAHTYLLLEDIKRQPQLPGGLPGRWGSETADYGMSPLIVDHPDYRDLMNAALRALPSLALSTDPDGFFGAARGIYANATQTGSASERAALLEWIEGDGTTAFTIPCGVRAQGGASRNQDRSPKHSLSLRFRSIYGSGKLRHPLFSGSPVEAFDSLQLRAMYNNSWIHSAADQRQRGTLIHDQWMRDTMLDLGDETAMRGRYVHLYINGLYWGVHNLHERADADHYAAYHGGNGDNYDAINGGTVSDGSREAYDRMRAVVRSRDWVAIQRSLDVDHFIHFVMLHRFGGNQDLKLDGNWRAAGGGPFDHPWEYYLWDVERVLEDPNNNGIPTPSADPSGLLADLDDVPDFLTRFGDRIHRAFFNGGPLTPPRNQERWQRRVDELELAIVAESARWGAYRRRSQPYSRDVEWRAENRRLLEQYFPARSAVALQNFVNMGFYPRIEAPEFNQHGGETPPGFLLQMTSSAAGGLFSSAKIYYTLDGSDPRLPGGALDPNALLYGDSGVALGQSALVRARVRNAFGAWSALNEAFFRTDALNPSSENLVVSEIHYNPLPPSPAESAAGIQDDRAFEFIELFNPGTKDIYLGGSAFDAGITFTFSEGTVLKAGTFAVIAAEPEALLMRHPSTAVSIVGSFQGSLANGGERLRLVDPEGLPVLDFLYDDAAPWPDAADGAGYSLTLQFPNTLPDPGTAAHWTASRIPHGTPGAAEPQLPPSDRDTDGDEYPDWMETYLASNPESVGSRPVFEILQEGTGGQIFRYLRNADAAPDAASLEYSLDLRNWAPASSYFREPVLLELSEGIVEVSHREVSPGALPPSVYLRLRIEHVDEQ